MKLNPYLAFDGRCREAFEFYEKTLGGSISFIQTIGESPMASKSTASIQPNWSFQEPHPFGQYWLDRRRNRKRGRHGADTTSLKRVNVRGPQLLRAGTPFSHSRKGVVARSAGLARGGGWPR